MEGNFCSNFYCSKPAIKIATDDYTVEDKFRVVLAELAKDTTITLPDAGNFSFYPVTIRLITTGFTLTIQRSGANVIYKDATGATSRSTSTQGAWITLEHDGADWHVIQDSGDFI